VRTRHRGAMVPALVVPDAGDPTRATVHLHERQARTSPGQACVAYDQGMQWCLGGGWVADA
jgi:tRNA U34 2-thiouridine synthase MnmA/TrmU